jgi:5-methylcytosine-specific restriction endonuclease McrA
MPQRLRKKADRMFAEAVTSGGAARCHYCGVSVSRQSMTRDHVKPRSRGGTDANENLVIACVLCNKAKGSRSAWHFTRWLLTAGGRRWLATRGDAS